MVLIWGFGGFRVQGFRVQGTGVGVDGVGVRVQGPGYGFHSLSFRVWCLGSRVKGGGGGV